MKMQRHDSSRGVPGQSPDASRQNAGGGAQRLIDRWRVGDQRAAAAIYDLYSADARRVVRFHLNRRFHARCDEEDAIQIVFMEVFRRLRSSPDRFESDEAFRRWVRAIARNRTIKLIKFQTAGRRTVDRETVTPDSVAFRHVADRRASRRKRSGLHVGVSDLHDRLRQLTPQSRRIAEMIQQNLTQEEMAARLGCTTRTVRRRLRRLRESLSESG